MAQNITVRYENYVSIAIAITISKAKFGPWKFIFSLPLHCFTEKPTHQQNLEAIITPILRPPFRMPQLDFFCKARDKWNIFQSKVALALRLFSFCHCSVIINYHGYERSWWGSPSTICHHRCHKRCSHLGI